MHNLKARRAALLPFALGLSLCANGADLKDPTRPPVVNTPAKASAEQKPQPRVTAIFISSGRRIAIFNAQPVQAGDSVGIYRIDEIEVRGVRYSCSGHSAFAPLTSDSKATR